jgi:hypothetical protein
LPSFWLQNSFASSARAKKSGPGGWKGKFNGELTPASGCCSLAFHCAQNRCERPAEQYTALGKMVPRRSSETCGASGLQIGRIVVSADRSQPASRASEIRRIVLVRWNPVCAESPVGRMRGS